MDHRILSYLFALLLGVSFSCSTTSTRSDYDLFVPLANRPAGAEVAQPLPSLEELSATTAPLALDAVRVIRLTHAYYPYIKENYENKMSKEAHYDFFIANLSAVSYGARVSGYKDVIDNRWSHSRVYGWGPELYIEKKFFNSGEASLNVRYNYDNVDGEFGSGTQVGAYLQYPLFASREALERESEKIFWRNELNDANLEYFRSVRDSINSALDAYFQTLEYQERIEYSKLYVADLHALHQRMLNTNDPAIIKDCDKVLAKITSEQAEQQTLIGWFNIDAQELKSHMGVPFECPIVMQIEEFNPFSGKSQDELVRVSLQTDPEIKLLRNAILSAEAELNLARRGKWDTSFFLSGDKTLGGAGSEEGEQGYSIGAGINMRHIDPRITKSMEREAQADIRRYQSSIKSRENEIFVDTIDAIVNMKAYGNKFRTLIENLPRYRSDYETGLALYFDHKITTDELLKKRDDYYEQQRIIADSRESYFSKIADLCASTAQYLEYLP
jgi:outer membrane protein TolC